MSDKSTSVDGVHELWRAMFPHVGSFVSVGIFSIFVNLLMLTGPLFMLQVYDRVLRSRSEETLIALSILVAVLYCIMGVLDYARGRVAARIGANFQARLDRRVFAGTLRLPSGNNQLGASSLRDLESVQKLLSSPALFALLDIPWAPIFLFTIFVFHPFLGWLALGGGAVLIIIAVVNQILTFRLVRNATQKTQESDALAEVLRSQREVVRGMGMEVAALNRWQKVRNIALAGQIQSSDLTGSFWTLSKTIRFFLQSLILAAGAYLFLLGEITAGAMIAASILLGRALSPIEQTIGQWPPILRAWHGWRDLAVYLSHVRVPAVRTHLPRPRAILEMNHAVVIPPGSTSPTLRIEGFSIKPGFALGVIGPSASGKSTLAKTLTGIWQPVSGSLKLDGASLEQYGHDLGKHVGYLPQNVTLFQGTVAENIARLSENPDAGAVVRAAKQAGAHEMILMLAKGYDTVISDGSENLSGGQKQRIGLARAMFGDPILLVLDEPNASLDAQGSAALNSAVKLFKSAGGSVIVMAHRPSGIAECDFLMVLQGGIRKAFGPRDEILRAMVENHFDVSQNISLEAGQ